MKKLTIFLVASFSLISCAGVSPSSLKPATLNQSKRLTEDFTYQQYYSLAGNLFVYTLSAGDYVAKYESKEGTYFEGPGKCLNIQFISDDVKKKGLTPPPPHGYACGVFVPISSAKDVKIYFYRDPEVSREIFGNSSVQVVDAKGAPQPGGGLGLAIAAGIDAAELKNLHFHQDQPQPGLLRAKLQ